MEFKDMDERDLKHFHKMANSTEEPTINEENLNLERCTFEFSQDGNCLKGSDFTEFLTIECASDMGIDRTEGCFFVLKTESWSIDSVSNLEKLFDRIRKVIHNKI